MSKQTDDLRIQVWNQGMPSSNPLNPAKNTSKQTGAFMMTGNKQGRRMGPITEKETWGPHVGCCVVLFALANQIKTEKSKLAGEAAFARHPSNF